LLILFVISGAGLWLLLRPPSTAPLTLSRVSFAEIPGWTNNDADASLTAFRRSCAVLVKEPASNAMGGIGYGGRVGDWRQVCTEADRVSPGSARTWFERAFSPFELHTGSAREALYTGYYEPEIAASRTRHDTYTTPVYGLPRDLITADLGLFRHDLSGLRITGHLVGGRLLPLPVRAQIDTEGLSDAPVLLYARDAVSVFFLHIQGSGRASFDDGTASRLAYAGQNGHSYTPIGRVLIANGELDRAHMSMQAIRGWLEAHPAEAQRVMEHDQSYIFFRELPVGDPALGSPGSEGVSLTPRRSIAIDAGQHPLGVPMFVSTEAPAPDPRQPPRSFACICIAQDTGGAIKGALRADIFWGFGSDAESIAGRMKSTGHLYVLLPNALASRIPTRLLETS
jgi:membrane-bound lytic murein transglycosylase A